jgi:hypothetical protein
LIAGMVALTLLISFGVPILIWKSEHVGEETKLWPWLKCELHYGSHDAVRHPLGGFKCTRCGESFDDLEDAGTMETGYVDANRRFYERGRGHANPPGYTQENREEEER